MADQSPRVTGGSNVVTPSAGGQSGSALACGVANGSFPPGVFIDPCRWEQRAVGAPLAPQCAELDVIAPCQMGLGGARAWSLASGDGQPLSGWSEPRSRRRSCGRGAPALAGGALALRWWLVYACVLALACGPGTAVGQTENDGGGDDESDIRWEVLPT